MKRDTPLPAGNCYDNLDEKNNGVQYDEREKKERTCVHIFSRVCMDNIYTIYIYIYSVE